MRRMAWAGVLAIAAWSPFWPTSPLAARADEAEEPGERRAISEEESEAQEFVDFHEITAEFTRRWGLAAGRSDTSGLPGIKFVERREHETPARYAERIRKAQRELDARVHALPPDGVPVTVEYDWPLPL